MSIRKIHKMMVLPSGYGQRGEEVCKKIKPFKIPKNLEFDVAKGEQPISLRTEFDGIGEVVRGIKTRNSDFKFDWNELWKPVLLNGFEKIYEVDEHDEGARVYLLKDGSFCLAIFAGSGLQYSRWAVFRKINDQYQLKTIAIIN